jgi:hypothetical protein
MARYYANTFARFVSVDPAGASAQLSHPISFNRYVYALDDPLNGIDPSGLQTCGETPIDGGAFNGQTIAQVMQGTGDAQLLAQSIWVEGGTIFSSDLSNISAYTEDLVGIGTALLNQWDVDNRRLSVFQDGDSVCPLGQCLNRSLKAVILALEVDANGPIFNSNGNMRGAERSRLNSILSTDLAAAPQIRDDSGNLVNIGCEGVINSLLVASRLLTGRTSRLRPDGLTLLFWNRASVTSTSTSTFPGNRGYTGWRGSCERGSTNYRVC